jgi:hypothetical protein
MRDNERPGSEIEPHRGDRRPASRDSRSEDRPARSDDSADTPETIADAVAGAAMTPATAETDSITATLVGIPELELGEFVYPHQLPDSEAGETRPVALFDLENRTDRPIRWRSARTKFVGDDRYTYQPAHVSLEPGQLGPGCHTRQVELEPGRRARMVTMVERLPRDVEIVEVVQTVARRAPAENERLVFSVE